MRPLVASLILASILGAAAIFPQNPDLCDNTDKAAQRTQCQEIDGLGDFALFGKKLDGCVVDLWTKFRRQIGAAGNNLNSFAFSTVVTEKGAGMTTCVRAGIKSTVPSSSNTIVLPSQTTTDIQGESVGIDDQTNAKYIQVNLTGTNVIALAGMRLCLGMQAGSFVSEYDKCSAGCDPAFLSARISNVHADSNRTNLLVDIPWLASGQAKATANGASLGHPWNDDALEYEPFARPICLFSPIHATTKLTTVVAGMDPVFQASTAPIPVSERTALHTVQWFGAHLEVAWACNSNRKCSSRKIPALSSLKTTRANAPNTAVIGDESMLDVLRANLLTRSSTSAVCCDRQKSVDRNIDIPVGTNPLVRNENLQSIVIGKCIDPTIETCCGGQGLNGITERCCGGSDDASRFVDGRCECLADGDCSSGACCRNAHNPGSCYNSAIEQCCHTGDVFNPESHQCCPINGLQSTNSACPCNLATDCPKDRNMDCCTQAAPKIGTNYACDVVANYHGLKAPVEGQRCTGTCYDTTWQTCCNGAVCHSEYEMCCNSTCCNKFTSSCLRGQHEAPSGLLSDNTNLRVIFDTCSSIEHLNPLRAARAYVIPTILALAALLSLALALVFVNKSSAANHMAIEIALMAVAALAIVGSIFLLFSPVLEFGILVIIAALVAIFAAGARLKWLNILAIVLLAVALLYLVNPFDGSHAADLKNRFGSGVFHSVANLNNMRDGKYQKRCTDWYGYFSIDTKLTDNRIDNNMVHSFGLCARGWLTALLFIAAFLVLLMLVALILAILALRRFKKVIVEPIELEITGGPAGPPVY